MKLPLLNLLLLLLVPTVTASAQMILPEFGKISLSDMRMKECSFERSAPALILFDETEVSWAVGCLFRKDHHRKKNEDNDII